MIESRLPTIYMDIAAWAEDIEGGVHGKNVQAVIFRRAYSDGAREGWFHMAKTLRDAHFRHSGEAAYGYCLRMWIEVARCMGLRNPEALLQLDRFCSRSRCQHHLVPTDKPLPVCKGCQQARYCSRQCQQT